ncbi:MAG TPA: zf-HC2 domain-containing protein [Candidatus Binataceae bacterium]|nr:zf-HC2 domain-containing protein [Candidatus Binataceae bacterium]
MAECNEIGVMLSAFGDGELEPWARRQVESHLALCTICVTRLADYSLLRNELKKIIKIPKLEGFSRSVMDKIGKLVVLLFFLLAMHGGVPSKVRVAMRPVDVRVDSVLTISEQGFGYGVVAHRAKQAVHGEAMAFPLPNGNILRVRARALDDDTIAMRLVLMDGHHRTMTTEVRVKPGDAFIYSTAPSTQGTSLLLRIRPSMIVGPAHQISARVDRRVHPAG